jgi:protein SCO1
MKRLIVPLIVVASVGLLLSIAGLVITLRRMSGQPRPETGIIQPDYASLGLKVPPFELTDQHGRPRTESLFDGRATILDFIFTNCPFACPMMMSAMLELQSSLKGTGVRFASISVDPQRDRPQQLLDYAQRNGADLSRWTFLTGTQATIDSIVQDSLQFALQTEEGRMIQLPDGGEMANIIHPTRLLLVGPDRNVIGMFDPNREEDMRMLEAKARVLARDSAQR